MTKEQTESLAKSLTRFALMAELKYKKGQEEHGGNLWVQPDLIDRMEEEVIDQWHYLQALRQQLKN